MAQYQGTRCDVDDMPGNCGMVIACNFREHRYLGKRQNEIYKGLFTEILAESDNPSVVIVTDKVGGYVEKFAKVNGFKRAASPVKNRHTQNNIVLYTRKVTKAEYERACKAQADDKGGW